MPIYEAAISSLFLFENQPSSTEFPANFRELAPPTEESEGRIQAVYELPESDRSFSTHLPSSSQYSSSDMFVKNPEVFDLEELDSYSGPVQVKKEPSPKPATSSKPNSSKAAAIPKPSPATKTRASSARKRKQTDSPASLETFPYENHGFVEASGFMTSFLNQESYGLNKMLESKLKKAEVTIADQGMIVAAKSQHYEDKFKAMTQEHQATIKKATHEAQAKFDAAQVQHEQDMASYWEGLKSSVVISLLQARLKMAYEAKAVGFECPSWNVDAWEAKLRDLGGNPVEHPAKSVAEEPSQVAEKTADAGGDAEKNAGADAVEAMVEEGAAP
ncbi:hypothetical protein HanIR_Chr16g0826311 [Helianthus annuus]|nr:hypothetical protein HanIR_Chr16g0826311 [Helianthus annuus]